MDDNDLWELMNEAWAAIGPYFEPVIENLSAETGLEPSAWGLLLAALTFEPEDTSPAALMVRSPYTAAEAFLERLAGIAGTGFLQEVEAGRYRLSPEGREMANQFIEMARAAMMEVDPLSPRDSENLAVFMGRLTEASLKTPPPPNVWSINLSFKLMPGLNPPLPYTEQAMTCIAAYRDDAHLAAWRRSGISATALETLTLLWRGEAGSLDSICKHLARRGHACQVYIDVLDELRDHGFIEGDNEELWVTGTGRVFRNKIETETDRFFFTPWSCLQKSEKNELAGLLTLLKEGLSVEEASS